MAATSTFPSAACRRRLRRPPSWLQVLALALALSPAAGAPPDAGIGQRLGGDLFIGGGSVAVTEPVAGDLVATGGSVDVDAAVAGDAVAAGGRVRFGVDIGQTVYAAGGQLNVLGKVGRNARVAGGQVEFGPKSEVVGNVSVAGGQVRLRGAVGGHVQMAGGRLLLDGPVGGDVVATGGQVSLGPNARIAGRLRYRSGEALERDPAAQVAGGVDKLLPRVGHDGASDEPRGEAAERRQFGSVVGVWTIGLMLLAALIVVALPGLSGRVAHTLRERTGWSLLLGFVVLASTPVAVVLLIVSLVGIPIALATVALYLALLPVAYVAAAIGIGDWALQRWQPQRTTLRSWRIAAACTAVLALALLAWVPWLGGVVSLAALLAGLGALWLQVTPWRTAPAGG